MSPLERSYRRAMLAYPRSWRRKNGEVMLGTLLDAAEERASDKPAVWELASLLGHGLGERLNRRSALVLSLVALALSVTGSLLYLDPTIEAEALPYFLSISLAPFLLSLAVAGILRELDIVPHLRALAGAALALPAWLLSSLAALSWSIGFEQADQGIPYSPLAEAFVPLFLAAWAFGTSACALVLSAVLRRTGMRRIPRLLIATACGAVIAPIPSYVPLMPFGSAGIALTLLILVLLVKRTPGNAPDAQIHIPLPAVVTPRPAAPWEKARMAGAAWIGTAVGLLAVAYALTGSLWFDSGADSTETMRQGMALGLLAPLPLVLTAGRFLESRRGVSGRLAASPACAAAAALVVAAAASGLPLGDAGQWSLLLASVGIGACAAARTAFVAGIGVPGNRLLLACAFGGGYAVFPGLLVSTAGAFAAPLLGIATLVWLRRNTAPQPVLLRA